MLDCRIFKYVDKAISKNKEVKRVIIDDKVFLIIEKHCGFLLSNCDLFSYIKIAVLSEKTISEILNKNDKNKVINISTKFEDRYIGNVRKLILNNGQNVYVRNKYYKKFKKYKLYGGDKATSAIKAYDDNDNLVGFFMPFYPDYFEKRYGATD